MSISQATPTVNQTSKSAVFSKESSPKINLNSSSRICQSNTVYTKTVVIIGAGVSGIAAGAKLLENGFTDFVILEAENHMGGRVFSSFLGTIPIELGAEWIRGEIDNVIYKMASEFCLTDIKPLVQSSFKDATFLNSNGATINKNISEALTNAFYEIMKTPKEEITDKEKNSSLGSFIKNRMEDRLSNIKKQFDVDDKTVKEFMAAFEQWQYSVDSFCGWDETSMSAVTDFWECKGNNFTQWRNHKYRTIFDLLNKKIPDPTHSLDIEKKIHYKKEVINIKWNKSFRIFPVDTEIRCKDDSVYRAQYVLITVPLGVLKERAATMFSPPLPQKKLQRIENLGFGIVDKIYVKFKNRWWTDLNGYQFLWTEEERKETNNWIVGIVGFYPINETDPVLRGWITGEYACTMESLSDNDVNNGLNTLFKRFFCNLIDKIEIECFTTSKWYSNPYFRGSHSCPIMKSGFYDFGMSDLAEPVCNYNGKPVLLFAGEAAHPHYFATVHGAIETGQDEAMRMLQNIFTTSTRHLNPYDVIIIGAGVSGLSAAKTLTEAGIYNIILLEAQSLPGGRVHTIKHENHLLELGAQWIHGEKSEVFEICMKNDLISEEEVTEGEGQYLTEKGVVIDSKLVNEISRVVQEILYECEEGPVGKSVGEDLQMKFQNYLNNCVEDSPDTTQLKIDLLDWHVRYQLIDNSCSDLNTLSAKSWNFFQYCGGNEYITLKNGYHTFIETLVNSLPPNVIYFKHSVRGIDWLKDSEDVKKNSKVNHFVKVTCDNGTTVLGQYLICTASLGYLKHHYQTMFHPQLPYNIREAINYLEFGVIGKIFLIFHSRWWKADVRGFQFVWSTEKERSLSWERFLTGFDVIYDKKPILLGWLGGEGAKTMETLTESEVGSTSVELLRKFTGNDTIPLPIKVVKTNWWSNEYFKGSYSNISTKCDENNINSSSLAEPVFTTLTKGKEKVLRPTILFAGEACNQIHYSTVHGAFESGKSQAKVILADMEESEESIFVS